MKTVRNPKEGCIYFVQAGENRNFTGILITIDHHPGKEEPYFTFLTTESDTECFYKGAVEMSSGVPVKEGVKQLLKEYWQTSISMRNLEREQKRLDLEKNRIWDLQNQILLQLAGEKKVTIPECKEYEDRFEEKLDSLSDAIKGGLVEIKQNKGQKTLSFFEKLGIFFDNLYEDLDRSQVHHS